MITVFLLFYVAPAIVEVGQIITRTVTRNQTVYLQYIVPAEGITIDINVNDGSIVIYGSARTTTPNEAFYDFRITNSQPFVFISFDSSTNSLVVGRPAMNNATDTTVNLAVQSLGASSSFALNTTMGDTTPQQCTTNSGIIFIL